jgi:hypothetical protein
VADADVLVAAVVVPVKIALKLWLPIPGMNLKVAVPEFVNCATPKR